MFLPLLLALSLQPQSEAKPAAPEGKLAVAAPASLQPLTFGSVRQPFTWNATLPANLVVDGLKVNTIFFDRREIKSGILKGADFGLRAQLEVTNTSSKPKVPGFAVAVFDAENRLLGVASGGTVFGTVKPGETETFDLNFRYVTERLPLGATYVLSLELGQN